MANREKDSSVKSSDITDESVYKGRRKFLTRSLAFLGSSAATIGAYSLIRPRPDREVETEEIGGVMTAKGSPQSTELTSIEDIANYNNYYEFSTSKNAVADVAQNFAVKPWQILVDGMVRKPKVFGFEELLKFGQEERIYRFRCVEGWSMVIPWVGFPLRRLLKAVEPNNDAKYVSFQTFYPGANPSKLLLPPNTDQMQASLLAGIEFPYLEGLRIDEAMHDLTLLATGIYGKYLPNQNGAPVRLVVPWKYGFKSIKSIVRITVTANQPPTTWNLSAPNEYGFYSNVNPDVDHPRWSQATERRIGEVSTRKTLYLNGYAKEVGQLYQGMNLRVNF